MIPMRRTGFVVGDAAAMARQRDSAVGKELGLNPLCLSRSHYQASGVEGHNAVLASWGTRPVIAAAGVDPEMRLNGKDEIDSAVLAT